MSTTTTSQTVIIEGIESILNRYFSSVQYLPPEVKKCATLMSQDLGKMVGDHLNAHGVDVNWSDGSYRPKVV